MVAGQLSMDPITGRIIGDPETYLAARAPGANMGTKLEPQSSWTGAYRLLLHTFRKFYFATLSLRCKLLPHALADTFVDRDAGEQGQLPRKQSPPVSPVQLASGMDAAGYVRHPPQKDGALLFT